VSSWQELSLELSRGSLVGFNRPPQNHLDPRVFGFAHYTYSDTRYKREVMTPLYTERVNQATFEVISEGGKELQNRRVTIIGGGAMGLAAGRELRDKGFEVTYVEPDTKRHPILTGEGFKIRPLERALRRRGLILELSGIKNLITQEHLFLMMDGAHLVHGSSKDNPFDMKTFKALADERIPWAKNSRGQRSATYVFTAAGLRKELHMPADGFTISHGGKRQNVPLKKFLPEVEALFRLGIHALTDAPVTHFPFFTAPDHVVAGKGREDNRSLRQIVYEALQ
jgi:hypothetical protein